MPKIECIYIREIRGSCLDCDEVYMPAAGHHTTHDDARDWCLLHALQDLHCPVLSDHKKTLFEPQS